MSYKECFTILGLLLVTFIDATGYPLLSVFRFMAISFCIAHMLVLIWEECGSQ